MSPQSVPYLLEGKKYHFGEGGEGGGGGKNMIFGENIHIPPGFIKLALMGK